ncbi:MAG: CooT family nickel-binding protein [Syntrophomonadaceae bacterium]|nr:CooT family nickel-binding protein [Syntrophomonadaceae bacterium]
MCEANIYLLKNGREELFMEKVDRIIPGEDQTLFLESVFGERRVVKAAIREMELVHHRIIIEEIAAESAGTGTEIWLDLDTDHGHFHEGEEVKLKLFKGYNMKANPEAAWTAPRVMVVGQGGEHQAEMHLHGHIGHINLGSENDGLVQVYALEPGDRELYAKLLVEVGHHHHHDLQPIGLPLEILPCGYSHARMGENYEVQVLKDGKPLAGAELKATYANTRNTDYPHHLVTDEEGKARLFLTARGNYLFSVSHDNITSTFTLVKSF